MHALKGTIGIQLGHAGRKASVLAPWVRDRARAEGCEGFLVGDKEGGWGDDGEWRVATRGDLASISGLRHSAGDGARDTVRLEHIHWLMPSCHISSLPTVPNDSYPHTRILISDHKLTPSHRALSNILRPPLPPSRDPHPPGNPTPNQRLRRFRKTRSLRQIRLHRNPRRTRLSDPPIPFPADEQTHRCVRRGFGGAYEVRAGGDPGCKGCLGWTAFVSG